MTQFTPKTTRYYPEKIPEELKNIPRWCGFQIVSEPNGKTRKIPLVSGKTGRVLAECNNPSTLRPFDLALRDAELRGLYLGFAFDPSLPYFFIDADDVVTGDGDDIRPDVRQVRDALDTYTEVSASGTGLHIIGRGAFPANASNREAPEGCRVLERYPLHGGRFCIMTGDVLPGYEMVRDRSDVLAGLFPGRPASLNGHVPGPTVVGELDESEMVAIVRWAERFWRDGRRHTMALHLSGYLGKKGVSREQAVRIIEQCAVNDSDPGAKVAACHASYDALATGAVVSGWRGMIDVCGLGVEDLVPLNAVLSGFWTRTNRSATEEVTDEDPPPPFPIEIFPPAFRAYAESAAASVPVPVEMVAIPMMGIAAAVIGNRAHLHLKRTWQEYATFFLACVADPGKAKSGAQGLAEEPMRALQRTASRLHRTEEQVYRDQVRENKAKPKDQRPEAPPYPVRREYYTTDITIEALAQVLEHNPGVVYSGDEFAVWVERMNQYRKGGDREQYMSIWAHRLIKVNRKTVGGSLEVDTPVVCVIGGIQPEVVPRLTVEARDGFVERILPYVPVVGPKTWNRRSTNEQDEWAVTDLFRAVDRLPMIDPNDEAPHPGVAVAMSQEAEEEWQAWDDENNALAAQVGGIVGGFYSKLEAHVARFALVLHILWNPDDPRLMVSGQTMRFAIMLGEFFRYHIHVFIPMLGKGLVPMGVSAGLAARVKSLFLFVEGTEKENGGWIPRSALYQRIYRVKKEELSLLLDTWIDLSVIEERVVTHPGSGRPGREYRWAEKNSENTINKKNERLPGVKYEVPWEKE